MDKKLEELKEFLFYDPETGIFTRKKSIKPRGSAKPEAIAGVIDNKGYIQIWVKQKKYRAHRLAWLFVYHEWPRNQIDHINGIKTDNRICNLRDVSNDENQQNCNKNRANTSGYTGVFWLARNAKWVAQIKIANKSKYLGLFVDPEEAHRAYLKAKAELHPNANLHLVAASPQHLPIIG